MGKASHRSAAGHGKSPTAEALNASEVGSTLISKWFEKERRAATGDTAEELGRSRRPLLAAAGNPRRKPALFAQLAAFTRLRKTPKHSSLFFWQLRDRRGRRKRITCRRNRSGDRREPWPVYHVGSERMKRRFRELRTGPRKSILLAVSGLALQRIAQGYLVSA